MRIGPQFVGLNFFLLASPKILIPNELRASDWM